jgi:phage terminase large subunit-like protein
LARPIVPLDEKRRRGTVEPGRERKRPAKKTGSRPDPVSVGATRDYPTIADDYVAAVLAGRIVAGQWVTKACRRFVRMRERANVAHVQHFMYSPAYVQDVCAFVERLPHVEGKWTTATIVLQPWQVFILAAVYGFRRPNGDRLVTTVFFEVGRKSAKSTLVAAAGLYHLACEHEPGAQVVCAATSGNQARIVFAIASRMVKRSAWLRELGFKAWANAITVDPDGGTMRPINAKSSTQDGLSPSFISLDESHAQTFELHDVLKSAQGARSNAALWAPTTAGYSLTSVGFALRSQAMKILDGVIESDHTFCILYELDDQDDWRDETTWIKALPMIGITPSVEYVQRYCADAQATPGMQGEFETKMCNRWLHSAATWLPISKWNACADASLRLEDFAGERAWIGVDLAERDDIAATACAFMRDGIITVFVKGYLPAEVVADRARAVPEYRAWVRDGLLITTPGNLTDYGTIEADLRSLCTQHDVQAIVFERYGALNLAANLSRDGLPATIASKNAKTFTPPAKELEARIKAGQFRHDGNSFLTWQASNVCVERRRDGSLLPTKESAESPHKIDAVDAVLLAMSELCAAPDPQVYEPKLYFLEA